uniref:Uncharacterized protein n=1 Tax=Chromera velia CCMP2878 TaxID=1169474 RepID=A0A0G4I077_9ALVE|eukprot:Cvel_9888.t1-p1 / transcript=Cvel_9888.t1 / gene=Cvel_9888 / organism=Chromera_velia_CCMP2878 / gene_product=hypothetical protein / transcript_product=hypothetical protein / location=Cvel_scaffold583:43962-50311(+) / protein_length=1061 / sequence_SO=supercontig / SO=protein_coding / is_pseudo=false
MIGQTSPSGFLPLAPPQQLNAGMPGHPPLPAPAPRQPPQPQNTPTNALHPHLPSPLQSQPGQTAAPGSDLTKFFPNLAPTPTGESAHRKLEESFPIQTSQPPPRGLLTPGSAALRQATASGEMANGVRRPVPQPQGMHQPQQQATAMAQAQAGGAQSQSTEGRKGGMAIMAMLGLEGQQHQGPPHRSQTPSHAAAPSRDPDGPTPRHLQSQQSADGGGMKISVAELFAMGGGGGAGQATPPQTTTASTPHAQPHAIGGAALPSQRVGTQPVSGYGGAAMQGHQATATPTAASRPAAALSQQIPTSEAEALYRQRLQQQQMLAGVAGLQAGVRASPSQPGVPGTSPAGVPQSVGLSGQQAQQVQRQMATTQQQPGGIFGHTAAPVTSSSSSSSASAAAAGSGSAPQAQTGLPVQLVQAAIAGGKLSSQGAQQIPAKVAVPPLVQKPPPSSAAVAPPAGTSLQQQQQQAAMAQLQTQTQQGQQDLIGLSSFGQLRGGNPPERQRTDGSASIFSNQTGGSLFRSAPPPPPAGQPSAVSATPTGSQQPQAAAASTPSHQQQWPLSGQQRASTGTVPAAPPGAPPTQTLQATQSYPATAGAGGARSQGPLPSPPQKSPAGGLGLWPQSPESLLSGGPSSSLVNVPLPPPGQPGDHGTAAGGLSASQRRPQGEGVWGSLHQQQQTGSASASTSSSVAAAAQAAARVQAASAAAGTGTAAWGAGATSSSSIWPSQQQQQQPGGLAQQQGTMGGLRSSTGVSGGQSIFGGAPKQPAPAATQPRGPAQLTSQLFPSGSASATAAGARMGASWSEMSPQGQARTTTGVAPPPPSFPITSQQQQQKAAGGLLNLGAPQGGHLSSGYGGASLQQQPQAPAAKAVNDWERGDRKISDSKIAELFSTAQRVQSQVTPGASQGVGGVLGGSRPGQGGSLSGPGLGGGMGTIGGQVPPLVGTTPSGGEALAASRQTSSSSGTFRAPPPAPGGGSSGGGLAGLGGSLGMGLRSVGGGVQMPLSGIVGGESSVKLGLHGQAAGGGGGMLAGLHGQAQGHAPPPQQQHHKIDQEWLALYK